MRSEIRNACSPSTLLVWALAFVLAVPALAGAQTRSIGHLVDQVYEYPVRPGTEAWQALRSHDEMVRATQVEPTVLASLSDSALLGAVLDYPLLGDILAHDSPQQGFDALRNQFAALDELLARPGTPEVVLGHYRRLDASAISPLLRLEEQGRRAREVAFVELLLAQPELLDRMDATAVDELLAETLIKRQQKLDRFDVYGHAELESTAFVAGRALRRAEPGEVIEKRHELFLESGGPARPGDVTAVFSRVAERILGDSAALETPFQVTTKDYSSYVYTPKGSAVSVMVMTSDWSAASVAACNSDLDSNWPLATRLSNCTRLYNCHSYAWYSQSPSNNVWMNSPGDDTYWLDGSYVSAAVFPGRKVSYADDDHSSIVVNSNLFRSKWGSLALMEHAPTYTPYTSTNLKYYRRAPNPVITVTGPTSRDPNQSGTWYCSASGGEPPYTYHWFKTYSTGGRSAGTTDLGTGTSKTTSHSTSFNIICDVTEADGGFLGTDHQFVDVDGPTEFPLPE